MIKVDVDAGGAAPQLQQAAELLEDGTPLFRAIAGVLEAETEQNFASQGRPDWVPLSAATVAERTQRNKGSSVLKILQDRGILASSVTSEYGADFVLIGAGGAAKDYAAIHQFGGTIERPAYSTRVRLRTDAKGKLLRQEDGKLAVFAKEKGTRAHKRYRETWSLVEAFTITIPARPYLPFRGPPAAPVLQPEAERSVLETVTRMLGDKLS